MPIERVKHSLTELHTELGRTEVESAELEQRLAAAQAIETHGPESIDELVQSLNHQAAEWEVEHPKLTALIHQVLGALTAAGF